MRNVEPVRTARESRVMNLWRVWYDAGRGGAERGDKPSFFCDVESSDPAEAIAWVRSQFGGTDWTLRNIEAHEVRVNTEMAMFDQEKGYGHNLITPRVSRSRK